MPHSYDIHGMILIYGQNSYSIYQMAHAIQTRKVSGGTAPLTFADPSMSFILESIGPVVLYGKSTQHILEKN
jgi:hypothetical protein